MSRETPLEAIELIKAGRKKAARALLLAILDIEPDNIESWLWLAACAATPTEYSRALREALRLDPTHPEARALTLKLAREVIAEHTGRDFSAERADHRQRTFQRVLFAVFLLALLAAFGVAAFRVLDLDLVPEAVVTPIPTLSNQELCQRDLEALRTAVVARCSGLEAGQACLMNGSFQFERAGEGVGDFTLAGDRMRLQDLASLQAEPYRLGGDTWGLAWLRGLDGQAGLLIGGGSLQGVDSQFSDFTLLTAQQSAPCKAVPPSGLLLQSRQQIHFEVNHWQVDMIGTAFIQATAGGVMRYSQLDGIAEVSVAGENQRLTSGDGLHITIDRSGQFVGSPERQDAATPYLTPSESQALADLAGVVGFQTAWHESSETAELLPAVTPETYPFEDLMVGMGSDVIAFSSDRYGSADVFLVDGVGRVKRLTDDPANDRQPALSLDGSRLVFSSDRSGNFDIFILNLNDNSLTQLTLNEGQNTYPSWAGEGIVFTSDRSGTAQVWQMGADGSDPRMLTSAENGVEFGRVSSEGVLAYSLLDGGIVVEQNGESLPLEDNRASSPAWSPDGTQLAYQSTQTGGAHVYIYDLASQSTRRLTTQSISGEAQPTWNPAGTHIAFVTWRAGEADLFIANAESGRLENRAVGGILSPAWGSLSISQSTPALPVSGGWQQIAGAVTSTLYDIDLYTPEFGLAVGENDTILQYANGAWGRMDTTPIQTAYGGERLTLYGVEVTSNSTAWAVGERGAIIRLRNGRWEAVPSPVQTTLYDVQGGWIVGAGGIILRQQPDETWEQVESPTTENLYRISLNDGVRVMGDNSTLLSQAGNGWRKQLSAIRGSIYDTNNEWLAADSGLYHFGTVNWASSPFLNGGNAAVRDIAALGNGVYWAVGWEGVILYGNEEVFTRLPNVTYEDLYAVDFASPDEGWAVGANGTLLHYTSIPQAPEALSPPTIDADNPNDLLQNWRCSLLQGTLFYQYDLILEPLQDDGTLLATGFLPGYDVVVLLEGEFDSTPADDGLIAEMTLHETEVIRGANYPPDGSLHLMLQSDGQLIGETFIGDDLVGEIAQCREWR